MALDIGLRAGLREVVALGRVAAELDEYVQKDAADGFILQPLITPVGLDEFVDRVVPLLQERGAFRTEYQGATLRSHLGLPDPAPSVSA